MHVIALIQTIDDGDKTFVNTFYYTSMRSIMSQEWLNGLVMLSIERKMLDSLIFLDG